MTPSPHKTDYIIITIPLQWKCADIGDKVDDRRGQQRLAQAANLTWPYPCEIQCLEELVTFWENTP